MGCRRHLPPAPDCQRGPPAALHCTSRAAACRAGAAATMPSPLLVHSRRNICAVRLLSVGTRCETVSLCTCRPEHVYAHLLRLLLHLLYLPGRQEHSSEEGTIHSLVSEWRHYSLPHICELYLGPSILADGTSAASFPAASPQLNQEAIRNVGLPQVLALFQEAPSTEARRNLFCVIFDAAIAQQIEVRQ